MSSSSTETELIINWVTAGLSLVGELFMLISYMKIPALRSSLRMKLVASIVIGDMLCTTSDLLVSLREYTFFCVLAGFLRQFGALFSVCWGVILSYISYNQLRNSRTDYKKKYNQFLILSCIIPGCTAL